MTLTNDQIHALLIWTDRINGGPHLAAARLVLADEKARRIKAGTWYEVPLVGDG